MKPFQVVRDAVTREVKTGGQNRWLGFLTTSLPSQPSDCLDFPLTSSPCDRLTGSAAICTWIDNDDDDDDDRSFGFSGS